MSLVLTMKIFICNLRLLMSNSNNIEVKKNIDDIRMRWSVESRARRSASATTLWSDKGFTKFICHLQAIFIVTKFTFCFMWGIHKPAAMI